MPLIPALEPGAALTPAGDATQAIAVSSTDASGDALLPIDPFHVARIYGVPVFEYPLAPDLSGYLDWDSRGAFIVVNSHHGAVRQRFTVAHELGHFYDAYRRNLPKIKKDRSDLASRGTDIEEIYANRFAASLLMPADAVRTKFEVVRDVGALARIFNVSEQAMSLRLRNLGLTA